MKLSRFHGNNYHIYIADTNIDKEANYPAMINLLLDSTIDASLKLSIIEKFETSHLQEAFDFAQNHKVINNIFQAVLVNHGAWSDNFSQKDAYLALPAFKKEREQLDNLFLYLLKKFPVDLTQETFLLNSSMLTSLLVYELPRSLDYALKSLTEEKRTEFFDNTQIDFNDGSYSPDKRTSVYFRIFHENNRKMIDVLINNGFNLNMIDHNHRNIGFYVNNKDLLLHLVDKGFNFDLNFSDGNQKLKTYIKNPDMTMDYNSQFLKFIEDEIALLPPDIEDMFKELPASFNKDNKSLFKKKFDFFYKNVGTHIYKDISISDVIALHMIKNSPLWSKANHVEFLKNFIKKENIPVTKGLERLYNFYIEENADRYSDKKIKLSDNEIYAFLDKVEYLISIKDEHFSVPFLLDNIGYTFFDDMSFIDKNTVDNMNNQRLTALAHIIFLQNSSEYKWKDNRYMLSYIVGKLRKENIEPVITELIKDVFLEKKSFNDIRNTLKNIDLMYMDFIKLNNTFINSIVQSDEDKQSLSSLIEQITIMNSLDKNTVQSTLKSKKRM